MPSEGGGSPEISGNENLKSLSDQLSDPSLKSSTRVLILFSLTMNKQLSFVQLLTLTGMGKGSLENHLEKLTASGYVTARNVKTFGGTRQIVHITEKGLQTSKLLLQTLRGMEQQKSTGYDEIL